MRTRIKICCIMTAKEAQMAVAAGADALGLVAEMPSGPGPIADDLIAEIAATVPPPVATFLLTSRLTAKEIAAHVGAVGTSTVQVVSHIDPAEHELLAALRPATRRVQVIHVENEDALSLIPEYAPRVHAFLLDSGRPAAAELGGTGRVHDWTVSAEFVRRSPVPVFLAGGLNPENAARAVAEVRPFGLDLCSGVRTAGRLDEVKLHAFFAAVRGEHGRVSTPSGSEC
jgi:phosphoribosylanthranilate isomerase